jgi:quercetin dioxygenase-like cupin family protein
MTNERNVIVLGEGEGEPVWFIDNFLTLKMRKADGGDYGLIEAKLPKGSETPFHRHHEEDEAFYVLEGELTVFLEGGRTVVAKPGSFMHIPKGVAHGFRVDAALKMLVLSDPAGFVEFVVEAGMAAPKRDLPPAGPPDMAKLERAAQKYRIDLLGPLPA